MKKINRIFLFGDSFIEGQGTYEGISDRGEFLEPLLPHGNGAGTLSEWRKNNSWNKFVKENTNCKVINFAEQGSSNYNQFRELNLIFNTLTDTDLVLFGFTSKLRDKESHNYCFNLDYKNNLLSKNNPLKGTMAWERISLEQTNFKTNYYSKDDNRFIDEFEYDFTKKFVEKFFTSIYDDYIYEYSAQINYLFYQEKFKEQKLNIIFFDLFEPYVSKKYIKPGYTIDKSIYTNYYGVNMHQWLVEYEKKYIKENEISVWECGHRRPDLVGKIYHPNQHGYKLYIDYLFKEILSKQYNFESKII